ncbi:MAG: 4Fe-4S cluster-binding domain-containing protein [Bacteroidetes bacterium]|nr:4Fe-4S cluster-binding domain-containing protein [Bacteroidota bacterium]
MISEELLKPLEELKDCAICPRECHINRWVSSKGKCRSDASFNIASICIHKGEEPVISGPKGICNIFFTNCNLQCIYCQNHQISDTGISRTSFRMDLNDIVQEVTAILNQGINMVGFVSPSHFIPQMKIIIQAIKATGYSPRWVYNTNAYDKAITLRSLEGLIDVYLPDFKYMDRMLARSLSKAEDYPRVAADAIKEMYRQKGSALHLTDENTANSGIVIRHLVLPRQVQNSLHVLRYIAEEISPKLHISLMSQYYPTARVMDHPFLYRELYNEEYLRVVDEMEKLGLENGWVQGIESKGHYRPDFDLEHPFE